MSVVKLSRRERRLLRIMREAAATVVAARKSLRRTGELLEARSKTLITYSEDGLELYDRVKLNADDRLTNLRSARVWCARVENDLQHLRAMLDRAIDIAEGGSS